MGKSFEQYQQDLAPYWARREQGEAYWRALGQKKDEAIEVAKQAVQARLPLLAPVDALDSIGDERGLPRYRFGVDPETDDEYRATLQNAWALSYWMGTAKGMLDELYRAFRPYTSFRLVTQQGRVWRREADGTISYVDTGFPRHFGASPYLWNSFQLWFTGDLPADWAGTAPSNTSQEANSTRGIIERWRSGHARPFRVVLVESGRPWGYPGSDTPGDDAIIWTDPDTTDWGEASSVEFWTV